jgi:hypothetical protein
MIVARAARSVSSSGSSPAGSGQGTRLDIGRLVADTGYRAAYDTRSAVADYLGWLGQGHQR